MGDSKNLMKCKLSEEFWCWWRECRIAMMIKICIWYTLHQKRANLCHVCLHKLTWVRVLIDNTWIGLQRGGGGELECNFPVLPFSNTSQKWTTMSFYFRNLSSTAIISLYCSIFKYLTIISISKNWIFDRNWKFLN